MQYRGFFTASALVASLTLIGNAYAAPQAFNATYSVTHSGITVGETKTSLSYQGNNYTFQKLTKANGVAAMLSGDTLTERSQGAKQGQTLQSSSYLYHHKNRRKTRQDQFQFSSPTLVKGNYEGKAYELKVPAGTIDPALLELRLMDDVKAKRPLNYQVTERGKLKQYQFQRLGIEKIAIPSGECQCEKIQVTRDEGKRQTTLWLAPELNYAPARIRHNEEGKVTEAQLTAYQAL